MHFMIEDLPVIWPYPHIHHEQYVYMTHIKQTLDGSPRGHCVLEMPAGTGKTVALISLILAYKYAHPKLDLGLLDEKSCVTIDTARVPDSLGHAVHPGEGGHPERANHYHGGLNGAPVVSFKPATSVTPSVKNEVLNSAQTIASHAFERMSDVAAAIAAVETALSAFTINVKRDAIKALAHKFRHDHKSENTTSVVVRGSDAATSASASAASVVDASALPVPLPSRTMIVRLTTRDEREFGIDDECPEEFIEIPSAEELRLLELYAQIFVKHLPEIEADPAEAYLTYIPDATPDCAVILCGSDIDGVLRAGTRRFGNVSVYATTHAKRMEHAPGTTKVLSTMNTITNVAGSPLVCQKKIANVADK